MFHLNQTCGVNSQWRNEDCFTDFLMQCKCNILEFSLTPWYHSSPRKSVDKSSKATKLQFTLHSRVIPDYLRETLIWSVWSNACRSWSYPTNQKVQMAQNAYWGLSWIFQGYTKCRIAAWPIGPNQRSKRLLTARVLKKIILEKCAASNNLLISSSRWSTSWSTPTTATI